MTSLAASLEAVCALSDTGSVKCWGYNSLETLGLGNTQNVGDAPGEMGNNLAEVDLGNAKKKLIRRG